MSRKMALRFIRQLYSLETLDTRFVVPATAPPKQALEEANFDSTVPQPAQNGREKTKDSGDKVQPPRWRTPEFYFYGVAITICVIFMFKLVLDVSKRMEWTHMVQRPTRSPVTSIASKLQTLRTPAA